MNLELSGKKVILTGGGRGLGRAALELFAREGADVAFFSRNPQQVLETAAVLKAHGHRVLGEPLTVTDRESYSRWLTSAAERLGGCDIFVHNISSSGSGATGNWEMTFELDVMGAVVGVQALQPFLEASKAGSIILMSSTAAVETFLVPQAFNALKAALITYGKQLSQQLGPKGIRVNMVSPGPVVFPGGNWSKIKEGRPALYASTESSCVLGRLGAPEDVAKAVVFLASPASSYTTGTNLVIDGGYTKRVQF